MDYDSLDPVFRLKFWQKVRVDPDCWEWIGYKRPEGYGFLSVAGRPRQAYRIAYELLIGPIPDGLVIDHLCRNPSCVNPRHLEPVTPAENARRVWADSQACRRGHPWTPENTYYRPDKPGRMCRACNRINDNRRYVETRRGAAHCVDCGSPITDTSTRCRECAGRVVGQLGGS